MTQAKRCITLVIAVFLELGCGSYASFSTTSGTPNNPRIIWPKDEVHDQGDGVLTGFDTGDKQIIASDEPSNRVWLNFEGGNTTSEQSEVLKKLNLASLEVPAFAAADLGKTYANQARDALIKDIVAKLTSRYKDINVSFSLDRPKEPFTTVFIGGKNFTPTPKLLGIAPYDVGNFHNSDVAFVMSKELSANGSKDTVEVLVNVMAHELGHSFGTRHIENDKAVMNPVMYATTNELDQSGPYPKAEGVGKENSKVVLEANLGSSSDKETKKTPPRIDTLAVAASGNVAQYSVLSLTNIEANPDHDLTAFTYSWQFGDQNVEGDSVRIRFDDESEHKLTLRVKALDSEETKSIDFVVGRISGTH